MRPSKYFVRAMSARLTFKLPDEKYLENLEIEEKEKLARIRSSLKDDEIRSIVEQAKVLKQRQDAEQGTQPLNFFISEPSNVSFSSALCRSLMPTHYLAIGHSMREPRKGS